MALRYGPNPALDGLQSAQNDPWMEAQSQFERGREGPDPTMAMNPQWAPFLDAMNQAAPGGIQGRQGTRGGMPGLPTAGMNPTTTQTPTSMTPQTQTLGAALAGLQSAAPKPWTAPDTGGLSPDDYYKQKYPGANGGNMNPQDASFYAQPSTPQWQQDLTPPGWSTQAQPTPAVSQPSSPLLRGKKPL